MPENGNKVFISYAAADDSFVARLAYFLTDSGQQVSYDTHIIDPNSDMEAKLDEAFTSADCGIVILSRALFAKNASKAATIAILNKERPGKILIPIWHSIGHNDMEEISAQLTETAVFNSDKHSLDKIIEGILKITHSEDLEEYRHTGIIELTTINDTKLVAMPLRPYNDWAIAVAKHPVTNKQYQKFLKNVKNDILDEIIHNHVSETINVNYLKSNFQTPCGKLIDEVAGIAPFFPFEDEKFSGPDNPVVCISLIEALGYVSWLNSILNFSGFIFTLVSPALWRYAAFGTKGLNTFALDKSSQADIVHRARCPLPVNKTGIRDNALGISDMFGNVWEWCEPDVAEPEDDQELINEDHTTPPGKTVTEIAGGGYAFDLDHISPFLSSELLDDEIFTRRSDLGFRIAALVSTKNLDPKVKDQLAACSDAATEYVELYFNKNYKYY